MRPSEDGADVASPVSLVEWFMSFYEHKASVGCTPVECILKAGEMLFVPVSCCSLLPALHAACCMLLHMCAHDGAGQGRGRAPALPAGLPPCAVPSPLPHPPRPHDPQCPALQRNWWHLAINLEESVAVTQNLVTPVSLPHVLQHLQSRSPALVSGCAEEARSSLYDRFRAALEERRPELLEQVAAAAGAARKRSEVGGWGGVAAVGTVLRRLLERGLERLLAVGSYRPRKGGGLVVGVHVVGWVRRRDQVRIKRDQRISEKKDSRDPGVRECVKRECVGY